MNPVFSNFDLDKNAQVIWENTVCMLPHFVLLMNYPKYKWHQDGVSLHMYVSKFYMN
jgi:hypothetical protein